MDLPDFPDKLTKCKTGTHRVVLADSKPHSFLDTIDHWAKARCQLISDTLRDSVVYELR